MINTQQNLVFLAISGSGKQEQFEDYHHSEIFYVVICLNRLESKQKNKAPKGIDFLTAFVSPIWKLGNNVTQEKIVMTDRVVTNKYKVPKKDVKWGLFLYM